MSIPGLYSVGDVLPEMRTGNVTIRTDFDGSMWSLYIGFPDLTDAELNEFRNGSFSLAITMIDGLLFFLGKIGNISWFDAPYEPRLTAEPMNYCVDFEQGQGAPLLILIVDTNTGILKHMRLVGLGHVLSQNLHAACRIIDEKRPIDPQKYNRALAKVYAEYPNSELMLRTVNPVNIFQIGN